MEISRQDFALVRTSVEKAKENYNLEDLPSAFYFFALELILQIQEDEIRDSITDTNFLQISGQKSGHDRGIDAVYVDTNKTPKIIHLFNCKYAQTLEKAKSSNFPSNEIDKIDNFIKTILHGDKNISQDVNDLLYSKIEEIWEIFETENPQFVIHICTNYAQGFEPQEKKRFERLINTYSNFEIKYHLIDSFTQYLTSRNKKEVNGKTTLIDYDYFEKSDGNVRSLIANIDARDLIRIVLENEDIRNTVNFNDEEYKTLKRHKILRDAFEDNVRIYQSKSPINKSIKNTALSEEESSKFFYYNNGVTITCDSFSYSKRRSPILTIKNLQIVNGSQTIYSLYEAFTEDPDKIKNIELLCRICETKDEILSTKIAEYTNSQNPVKSRDIRSVDFFQQKLEEEFNIKGLFYERKRNQHSEKPKNKRIDAEKAGQVIMAFYNKSPYEAKNRKASIFSDKYEDVFNENITADKILLPYNLFLKIEHKKDEEKIHFLKQNTKLSESEKAYILYASYYILYIIGELARHPEISIDLELNNLEKIWNLYDKTIKILETIIKQEKKIPSKQYSPSGFFRSNKPKKLFEDLTEEEISNILK